jgi:TcpE family
MSNEKNRVTLHVLNDYLKFDRKVYQLFGVSLGRPLKLKTLLYFLAILAIEIIIYFTPIIGATIRWLPFVFLIGIPAGLAYLLSDVKTEGRIPLAFFRSVILYHLRKLRRVTYFRGREIAKTSYYSYRFGGYSTVKYREYMDERNFKPRRAKINIKKVKITNFSEK